MENALRNILREMLESPNEPFSVSLWKLNKEIEKLLIKNFGSYLYNPFALAKKFNIEIFYVKDLDFWFCISATCATYQQFQDVWNNRFVKQIQLNPDVPFYVKKYAIGYCLAEFLLLPTEQTETYTKYSPMELLCNSKKDLIKHSFALLLMHPVHKICELLQEFSEKSKNKVQSHEKWIRFLSERCNSSSYYAGKAYYLIQNLFAMADVINDHELIQLKEEMKQFISYD